MLKSMKIGERGQEPHACSRAIADVTEKRFPG